MNGLLKALDTMGMYVSQLEAQLAQLQKENELLKEQLQKATKAEA